MKNVYLAYDMTETSEIIKAFKKEEDAENYIRQRAKDHMINIENDFNVFEGRDYNKRLWIEIRWKDEDPDDIFYARLLVVEKELN